MYSPLEHGHYNKRPSGANNGRPVRLYQVWKGRNKFFLGGRFVFGPDAKSLFLTVSLILVPVFLFWLFVAKGLIIVFPNGHGLAIVIFSAVLTAYIVILLLLTSARDPGIIPRNRHPPYPDDGDTSTISTDWGGSTTSAGVPLTKTVAVNGIVVKVKYCQTCMLYRPPRCSHCSVCNNCVEKFDHHCPWVGQCIGKRNYRSFFLFVSSTTTLCVYVLVCSTIYLRKIAHIDDCSIWKAIQMSPISGLLVLYTFFICWFVGGLTAFHVFLISTNQTTYENFRYRYDRNMNPYNVGLSQNIKEVFCTTIPKSRNNFRETVRCDSLGSSLVAYPPPDMQKHNVSFGRLERCGTKPRHEKANWDKDMDGNESCLDDRGP